MENVMTVKADTRKEVGKKIAKKLRRDGKIPAIIYGGGKETIPISFLSEDVKEILKSEKGENTVLRIQRGDINVDAMLQQVQYDYLSDNIIHVDLLRIDVEKPVNVSVPIKAVGEAVGVKVEDGIFDFITREIKVKCLVTKIPKEIVVDISDLHSGSSIKLEDLDIGEGIELLSNPHTAICAVTAKGKIEEIAEEVVEEEEAAEEGEAEEEVKAEDKKEGAAAADKGKQEDTGDKKKK